MEDVILVRYGEIGLKGLNRASFEKLLVENIKRALTKEQDLEVTRPHGRIYAWGIKKPDTALRKLSKVPGIVSASKAKKTVSELESIERAVMKMAEEAVSKLTPPLTFKVEARRADKRFPLTSPELNQVLGGTLLSRFPGLTVDLHNPDLTIKVEVRDDGTYVYWDEQPGPGGLPVGSSGRGLLLLSGGIDSPVAGYMAMKRGVALDALHFWSYPITGERARDKVQDLCKVLKDYCPSMRLFIAPFTQIQTQIIENCPEKFRVTVMRRMMMRVASILASRLNATSIFTGENLGQVASQTQESLSVIQDASSTLILRPLVCFDKHETTEIAKAIGTFEISALPYEDCCSVFVPKHPVTKPRLDETKRAERNLKIDSLVQSCAEGITQLPLD